MHLSIYKSQIGSDLICTPIWLPLQSFAHQTLFTDIFKAFAEIESMAIVEQCTSYVHSLIHITRDKKSSDVIQAMDEVQVMAVNVSARATSLYYAMFFIHFITTLFGGIELGRERRLDWRLVKHNAGRWLNSDIIFESFFLFLFFFPGLRWTLSSIWQTYFADRPMRNKYSFWLHTLSRAHSSGGFGSCFFILFWSLLTHNEWLLHCLHADHWSPHFHLMSPFNSIWLVDVLRSANKPSSFFARFGFCWYNFVFSFRLRRVLCTSIKNNNQICIEYTNQNKTVFVNKTDCVE